jgi:hypothetical protein
MADRRNLLPAVVVASAAAAAFLLDRWMPLGSVGATFYPAVVLLSLWSPRQRQTYITAAACTVLVALGLFLSSPSIPFWHGVANRFAGIPVVWTVALYGHRRIGADAKAAVIQSVTMPRGQGELILVVDD